MRRSTWLGLSATALTALTYTIISSPNSADAQNSEVSTGTIDALSALRADIAAERKRVGTSKLTVGRTTEAPARLMALIDNRCVAQRATSHTGAAAKLQALSLSARLIAKTARARSGPQPLLEAKSFDIESGTTLAQLQAQAESDECILRVNRDEYLQVNPIENDGEQFTAQALPNTNPNDPQLASLTHLAWINTVDAWNTFFSPGRGIKTTTVVAIVDSGIDATHDDLSAHLWRNTQGRYGYDFVNDDPDPSDDFSHGTHVAGLIGAIADNGVGVAGVMGAQVRLMAVKVLDGKGGGNESAIANGIIYAADNGAHVINLSMSVRSMTLGVRDAMKYASKKGAVIVVAAGNDEQTISATDPVSPAMFAASIPGAIAVASIDTANGELSTFSNRSPAFVEIAAPGAVTSSDLTGLMSTLPGNKYGRKSGTSMSAPLVSGAAALTIAYTRSHGHKLSHTEILRLLVQGGRKQQSLNSAVRDGTVLDLRSLARYLRYQFAITSDAGTETQ